MKTLSVSALALATIIGVVGSMAAAAPSNPPPSQSELRQLPGYERNARTAQSRVASDSSLRSALAQAVKSKNNAQVAKLLVQAGFSAEQVQSARLALVDETRGGGSNLKPKVTIRVRCCPLEIIIVISW